jgi:hypothetical protein
MAKKVGIYSYCGVLSCTNKAVYFRSKHLNDPWMITRVCKKHKKYLGKDEQDMLFE